MEGLDKKPCEGGRVGVCCVGLGCRTSKACSLGGVQVDKVSTTPNLAYRQGEKRENRVVVMALMGSPAATVSQTHERAQAA